MESLDVVVIGAGVAGLSAATELVRAGLRVTILEARERIGGRILFRETRGVPLELGAHFIHGRLPQSFQLCRVRSVQPIAVNEVLGYLTGSTLVKEPGFRDWYLRRLGPAKKLLTDVSYAEFMRGRAPNHIRYQQMADRYVSGYYAADLERISVQYVAYDMDIQEGDLHVIPGGYGIALRALQDKLGAADIRLRHAASRIEWNRNRIRVTIVNRATRIDAKSVIVTVPIGVLKAPPQSEGVIEWVPALPRLGYSLSGIENGSVLKIVARFQAAALAKFQQKIKGESLSDVGFIYAAGCDFAFFFDLKNQEWLDLILWAGGKLAGKLSELGDGEIEELGIIALAEQFGFSRPEIEQSLETIVFHNWQRDIYSRGAYSYPLVNGLSKANEMLNSVEETIYFAGEAVTPEGPTGTVEAAIESGRRAARALLEKFR